MNSSQASGRIIVVDDTPSGLYVKSKLLRSAGWAVIEAVDGETACAMIGADPGLEVAIVDVHLPDMLGFEVCRRSKLIRPELPVLLTSATFIDAAHRAGGLNEGADAYLTEPIEAPVLLAQVRALYRIRAAERRNRESEARLQLALEAGQGACWHRDLVSGAFDVSSGYRALYGLAEDAELSYENWLSLIHPDDREHVRTYGEKIFRTGGNYVVEFRIHHPKLGERWLMSNGRLERDREHTPIRFLGVTRDITSRKIDEFRMASIRDALSSTSGDEAGTTLEESGAEAVVDRSFNDRLKLVLASGLLEAPPDRAYDQLTKLAASVLQAPVSLVTVIDTDRQVFVSTHGLPQPLREAPLSASYCRHVIARGEPVVVRDARTNALVSGTGAWRDGFVAYLGVPITNRDGIAIASLCVADSTPRQWTTRELMTLQGIARLLMRELENQATYRDLRESEHRLLLALEAASIGMWEWDVETGTVNWSAECHSIFGFAPQAFDFTAPSFDQIVHPGDLAKVWTAVRGALERDERYSLEFRIRRPDGEVRWVETIGRPIVDPATGRRRMIGTIADITERKDSDDRIKLLLREVSHRSKNMLAVVQTIAHQSAKGDPSEFLKRFDARIRSLAASQELIVGAAWQAIDLESLVRAQLAHLADLLGSRIAISGPNFFVTAAAAQTIAMAVHELATNAGKYGALSTAQGSVEIAWQIADAPSGRAFTMSWRETGGPPVLVPARKGFGSTVIKSLIALAVGGEVDLAFNPDGVSWTLSCSADRISEGPSKSPVVDQHHSQPAARMPTARTRVLLVEDEPLVAHDLAQQLASADFDVVGPAPTVAAAFAHIKATPCDIAILDVDLGAETSEAVAHALERSATPFIVVSAHSRDLQPMIFRDAPQVAKPVPILQLVMELRRCLSARE